MFVDVDQESGLPTEEDDSLCVHSIAEMKSRGFQIVETVRGILCTEVHYNGPFHLEFPDSTIAADAVDSDFNGIKSTHRVVLSGGIPGAGDKVAFRAIAD
jgi:hypothetical protein